METAHSFLYQSRPGDARNTFRNSSSPASCSRCASRNRFTSSSARSGANFIMALASAESRLGLRQRRVLRLRRLLCADGVDLLPDLRLFAAEAAPADSLLAD